MRAICPRGELRTYVERWCGRASKPSCVLQSYILLGFVLRCCVSNRCCRLAIEPPSHAARRRGGIEPVTPTPRCRRGLALLATHRSRRRRHLLVRRTHFAPRGDTVARSPQSIPEVPIVKLGNLRFATSTLRAHRVLRQSHTDDRAARRIRHRCGARHRAPTIPSHSSGGHTKIAALERRRASRKRRARCGAGRGRVEPHCGGTARRARLGEQVGGALLRRSGVRCARPIGDQPRNDSRARARETWRRRESAFSLIWRTRSRVIPRRAPICSSVIGSSPSRPK